MSDSNRPNTKALLDKALLLLRSKIKEHDFTQKKVQKELGWGISYISQLFRKEKGLRFDQILDILHVIGVPPADFFRELFPPRHAPQHPVRRPLAANIPFDELVVGMTELLITKGYLSADEILSTARSFKNKPMEDTSSP